MPFCDEINRNRNGSIVTKIKQLNNSTIQPCIADYMKQPILAQLLGLGITPSNCVKIENANKLAALVHWAAQVRQDGNWDHKPIIAKQFRSKTSGNPYWYCYKDKLYYYDIWSNIHYGYIGTVSRFDESVLLDGAGLEQIVSNSLRFSLSKRTANTGRFRDFDDISDRESVKIGIQLYKKYPTGLSYKDMVLAVVTNSLLLTQPISK